MLSWDKFGLKVVKIADYYAQSGFVICMLYVTGPRKTTLMEQTNNCQYILYKTKKLELLFFFHNK